MRLPISVDFGRAVFAVGLSVLLYFVAVSETNPESWFENRQFQIPVQPVNVPSGLVVTDRPPSVYVRVRAPQNVFSRLSQNSFTATVDCSTASAGDNPNLPITVNPTDPEVREAQADPSQIQLLLEPVREQQLPVRVNVTGQPPQGYLQGQPSVDPARVTVAGAASLVGRATEAVVELSVDRVTVSVNGVFTPKIVDDRGNDLRDLNLRMTPPSVTVQVPITQQTQYKEVGVRPVAQGQPAPGYVLQPLIVNPATVTLRGDPSDLESANFVETAPIDISGISGTVVRNVPVAPPPRTLLLDPSQQATVTISVTALTVSQTVRVPPSVINVGPNVQVVSLPQPVSVTISGPAPALSTLALNSNDFRVVLDLSGKGPGKYDIDATAQNVPTGLKLEGVSPSKVQVELRDAPPPATPTPAPAPPPAAPTG